MLEELLDSGIEDIALIIGQDDREDFQKFFSPLSEDYKNGLSRNKQLLEDRILEISNHLTYIIQKERLGFGHAIYMARDFVKDDPVLMTLGDFLYKSSTDVNATKQVMDAYYETGKLVVSLMEIPLERVVHYGVLHGVWDDEKERFLSVDSMVEKPTHDYAEEYLAVMNSRMEKKYFATFGEYILTPEVFEELGTTIKKGIPTEGGIWFNGCIG